MTRTAAKELPAPAGVESTSVRPTDGARIPPEAAAGITYENYDITVYTGKLDGAGTDGDVYIWLDGTVGGSLRRSGWQYLDNADDNFERGAIDYFPLRLPDLGHIIGVFIYYRPGGSWNLDSVVVNGRTYIYMDWLDTEGWVQLEELGVIEQP